MSLALADKRTNGLENGDVLSGEVFTAEEISRELSEVKMFLGANISYHRAGIIRPGIMAPKLGTPENIVKKFHELESNELPYDVIAKELGKDAQGKSWLKPENVDYFTIRHGDCEDPEHADQIKALYADRKTGRVKRIPITLPFDDIDQMATVKLVRYDAETGKQYYGRYIGQQLVCETVVPKTGSKRTFGPRQRERVPCNPDTCVHYQNLRCKFRGVFICRVQGIPGMGVFAITSAGFHNMAQIRSRLEELYDKTKDRCGLSQLPPVLFLRKIKKKIRTPDGTLTEKWIHTIDMSVPQEKLLAWVEATYPLRKRVEMGRMAADVLNRNPLAYQRMIPDGGVDDDGVVTGEEHAADTTGQSTAQISEQKLPVEGKKQAADSSDQKQAGSDPKASAKSGSANTGKTASTLANTPLTTVLAPFLTETLKNPLFKGADKASLWHGVVVKSIALLKKLPKDLLKDDMLKLKEAISADISSKNVSGYLPAASHPAGGATYPVITPEDKKSPLDDDWPDEIKEVPLVPAPGSPKPVGKEEAAKVSTPDVSDASSLFGDIPAPLGPYLESVRISGVLVCVPGRMRIFLEDLCKEKFGGKSLAQLEGNEIKQFRDKIQVLMKKKVSEAKPETTAGSAPA